MKVLLLSIWMKLRPLCRVRSKPVYSLHTQMTRSRIFKVVSPWISRNSQQSMKLKSVHSEILYPLSRETQDSESVPKKPNWLKKVGRISDQFCRIWRINTYYIHHKNWITLNTALTLIRGLDDLPFYKNGSLKEILIFAKYEKVDI